MPQSFASVPLHIIYSTKGRLPFLTDDLLQSILEYFGAVADGCGCRLLASGGVSDHVHLLVSLSRTITIADLIRTLKSSSSRWIHDKYSDRASFAWQSGYAVFGVSESNIQKLKVYIANQHAHHRTVSFQDEYRSFLARHGIDYDERYVWD